jgi:EmrB/QacA subfamily drug resistance transporter
VASPDARRWLTLLVLSAALLMDVLDFSIVNVALPEMQRDLGFSMQGLQWVVSAYALTLGGFLLLGGRAADLLGRRRVFLAGLALFTLAALVGGFAQTPEVLIAARAAQGLGAAMSVPAALSIITATFPEGPERNRALGVWSAVGAGGVAAGVILGGVLTETAGWRWVFWINVPVGLAAIALTPALIREGRARVAPDGARGLAGLDLPGAVSVTAGLLVLVYTLSNAGSAGFASPGTLGGLAFALILLAAFVSIESRARNPLVPLGIFRSRTLAGANLGAIVVMGVYGAVFLLLSLYMQQVLGYPALATGFAFLPMALAGAAASAFLGPRLVTRFGARSVLVTGMVVMTVAFGLLARVLTGGTYAGDLLLATLLLAVGGGVAITAFTAGAVEGVGNEEQGVASGLVNTSFQVGVALGIAVLLTVAAARTEAVGGGGPEALAALAAGFRYSFFASAVITAVGALVVFLVMRRPDVPGAAGRGEEKAGRG